MPWKVALCKFQLLLLLLLLLLRVCARAATGVARTVSLFLSSLFSLPLSIIIIIIVISPLYPRGDYGHSILLFQVVLSLAAVSVSLRVLIPSRVLSLSTVLRHVSHGRPAPHPPPLPLRLSSPSGCVIMVNPLKAYGKVPIKSAAYFAALSAYINVISLTEGLVASWRGNIML